MSITSIKIVMVNGGGAGAHASVNMSNIAMSGGDGAVIILCYKEK